MRRSYGGERGVTREQAEQLARQRDDEVAELKKLEAGMQSAARDLQSTQRQASTKVREALGEMQQMELGRDMERNAQWIRRGMGQYAVMSESQITAGLNEVRDQLKQAQQAMGKGADPKNDQAVERALQQVEQYRRMLEQMGSQQGQRGKPGRDGQPGQQPGQQGQQGGQQQQGQQQGGQQQGGQQQGGQQQGMQQGNQTGSQQGGQQQGGQQQGGQQSGQQSGQGGQQSGQQGGQGGNTGGNQTGGYRNGQYGPNGGAWNGGLGGNWLEGPVRPQDLQRSYQETLQSLQQLQQQFRDDPNAAREISGLIRGMREFDPGAFGNDPLLSQRIAAALAGVEQVEMELRRKVDDSSTGGSVRSQSGDKVPEGFAKQVEEYFRKLSKGK